MGLLLPSFALPLHFHFISLLFSSILLTNCLPSVHHECHEHESYALLQFKDSFVISKNASYNPSSYPKTDSWKASTDCCSSWVGIECDEVTGHVIAIDLSSSQLYGSMHPNSTLFSLVHLQKLDLSDNDFNYSRIPARIGELSQLTYLNLSQFDENTFSGEVPLEVSHLSNLLYLDLRTYVGYEGKSLPGVIINQLRLNISTLRSLVQNSSGLVELHLNFVIISASIPYILTNLTYLQTLNLANCDLLGEFPIGIFHLPKLRILRLRNNQNLRGMLPDFPSGLPMSLLSLSSTNFYGPIPASIGNLTSLKLFSIQNCKFYGSIPSSLGNLNQLTILYAVNNLLTGEISPSICNLKSLIVLDLSDNNLSGLIPSCLGNFSQSLQALNAAMNKLIGYIPQTYMKGCVLTVVDFSYNNLMGPVPREWVNCGMLEALDVSYNQISDSFPAWLGSLPDLKVICLQQNKFYGAISYQEKSMFPKLHIIDLSHNDFSGDFPLNIIKNLKSMTTSNISQLQYNNASYYSYNLTISNKGITMNYGNIQKTFFKLIIIDLSHNRITGEIPEIMGDLKGLVLLNLSNNMLSGGIPSSLGKLSNLETLDFSVNCLSGQIPQQLTQLTFLAFFNVSFNNLSGPIPESNQFLTFRGNFFEGNQGLCGIQVSKKCDEDYSRSPLASSEGDQESDSGSFFEFGWKVVLIGYGGGLVAGIVLGSAFSPDFLWWLKKIF